MKIDIDEFKGFVISSVSLSRVNQKEYTEIEDFLIPLINSKKKAREVIADAFDFAIKKCPNENPSDIWHHIIYRVYKRHKKNTNPEQSWVRTSGEAFELMMARHYNPFLKNKGIRLKTLFSGKEKKDALNRMGIKNEVGSSKVDVIIEKYKAGKARLADGYGIIGGLHFKVSLAERVSDDIPASRIMMREGLISILITLDVKSFPPPHGDLVNRGEFGSPLKPSDKRNYIEVHGDFDACFSYNLRTIPSENKTLSGKKIIVLPIKSRSDKFVDFLTQ